MNRLWWWVVEPVSRFLEHDERQAVLGDLVESRLTGPHALMDVLDVVIRRQGRLWMTPRPWLIFFALILPLGMLLSIVSRQTSSMSAVYLWMYANNWDAALTQSPGFWRLFAETTALVFVSYLTLACWSWTSGYVIGSFAGSMRALNSLLLCVILFFGEIIGAPAYSAFFHQKLSGDLHLPDANAAIFDLGFYRVVLPVIVQILLIALPALWGLSMSKGVGTLRHLFNIAIWTAAVVTLAVVFVPELGLCFFLATRVFHLNAPAGIWTAIRATQYLRPVEFWPIVFLIAHAIMQRWPRRAAA